MQTIQANGVELCAETFGERGDPAILHIHGAGNTMLSWDDEWCARLARERFVIRYDLRDAGASVTYEPGAPPYDMADEVDDAAGVLDAFGVERAHVVGLSGGAALAQRLALDRPERVASLVLFASTPGIPGEAGGLPAPSPDLFANEPSAPDWSDRAAVVEHLVELERPYSPRFDEAAMRALAERVVDHSRDVEAMLTNPFQVDTGPDWRDRLGSVRVPTLVVHGAQDPLFPLPHGEALAEALGAELIVVDGMGHEYPPRREWDRLIPAILAL
jgi:pimeloyl-ACP methyl ester carboxylesterase